MSSRCPICLTVALLFAPAMALAGVPQTPAADLVSGETPATDAAAANLAFAASLDACAVASHQSPHPFVSGFTVEHTITGLDGELCVYSQSMPGNMRMECKLGEPGRSALALEFRDLAAGRMSGSTGDQPAWTKDCEIVTADGKRMPLGKR